MDAPMPAPEIVVSLPRRGKIRVTSLEEADAVIAQASIAKEMMISALKTREVLTAEVTEPEWKRVITGRRSAS